MRQPTQPQPATQRAPIKPRQRLPTAAPMPAPQLELDDETQAQIIAGATAAAMFAAPNPPTAPAVPPTVAPAPQPAAPARYSFTDPRDVPWPSRPTARQVGHR